MKLKFLGGAEEVGRLCLLMKNKGANLFLDNGIKLMSRDPSGDPAKPGKKKQPDVPLPCLEPVDSALLTHCHIDHSGMMPKLAVEKGAKIFGTPMTLNVSELLWRDTLKVARAEGFREPFQSDDIITALRQCEPIHFGETFDVAGLEVKAHSAGHIPGATMFEMRGDETTLFTGDLHTFNTKLVYGAHPVKCDNLIIESTYAGRFQRDRIKEEQRFVEKVKEVVERGGKAIIPCFAVGRTQEVMLILKHLKYDMWVDGMGKTVNRIYMDSPQYLRSEKDMRHAKKVFSEVRTPTSRVKSMNAEVIVTTSGMLDGGPVLRYIMQEARNPKSAILIPGYQAEGSNGRLLMEKNKVAIETEVFDEYDIMDVKCEVDRFDLSAHADHKELMKFIKACDPNKIVLMHGDCRELMAKELEDEYKVFLPLNGQEFEL
ncbi:MAG TPA: MBL fold metallo-hydrolase [Methanomassiliicoccales archaeon]|nr:MBL fold metallo-hydrolase [Methanomassiliicoccales archaeon]